MKILSTENNLSYNVNNTCQIYIIKQCYFGEEDDAFNKIYADLLKDGSFIEHSNSKAFFGSSDNIS